jgi:hypothetical protein
MRLIQLFFIFNEKDIKLFFFDVIFFKEVKLYFDFAFLLAIFKKKEEFFARIRF